MMLPHKFKKVGYFLLVPSLLLGVYLMIFNPETLDFNAKMFVFLSEEFLSEPIYFRITEVPVINTLAGSLFIIGCLLVGFSKEKVEDEYIKSLRLSSLQWAVLINYLLLLVAFLFIYGMPFLQVMIYNMFTVLLLFVGRFNFLLYRNSRRLKHAE